MTTTTRTASSTPIDTVRPLPPMSLLGLAIIGRRNEPLYLCDCARALEQSKQQRKKAKRRGLSATPSASTNSSVADPTTADGDDSIGRQQVDITDPNDSEEQVQQEQQQQLEVDDDDPFGFATASKHCDLGQSLSFPASLLLHSALDYVDERIETSSAGLPVVTNGRTGHWLGRLTRHGDDDDDGHEDSSSSIPPASSAVYGYITATNIKFLVLVKCPVDKESTIRLFLNGIHDSYITHQMNPFSSVKPGQVIRSSKFDSHICEAVRDYEDNRLQSS